MAADFEVHRPLDGVRHSSRLLRDLALPCGFVLVAVGLWMSPRRAEIPVANAAAVERALLIVEPRRTAMSDPPQLLVEGRFENCNACHQIFRSAHGSRESVNYHTDILLNHGLNARCVNCHDVENRERLVLRDGKTVTYSETPLLCAQCHGTTFRDWQNGTHGKTLGSWKTGSEEQRRLACNECHDPHSPRYSPYQPLPGPNTLRMGTPPAPDEHHLDRSPLRRWRSAESNLGKSQMQGQGGHP